MFRKTTHTRFFWQVAAFLAGAPGMLFGQLLYVANNGDHTISSYVIDQDSGSLAEILPRVATPGGPTSVAIHPNRKFAFVTNGGPPSLAGYSIDPATGALTQVSNSPLVGGSNPQGVAIDPAGKFAFVAHPGFNNMTVFSIDDAGGTTPVPGSPFATPANPYSVVVHPNGKFVYVAAQGAGQIAVFSIGANGALTAVDGSPFAARNAMQGLAMDPTGKTLYAVERQDNGVLAYAVNATSGALTPVTGSPFSTQPNVSGVAVDPTGKFLYASNFGTVIGYRIGATGALTRISAWGAAGAAWAVIIDPSGKFLYIPGANTNDVTQYAIDANSGVLQFVELTAAGASPQRGATVLLDPPVPSPIRVESAVNRFGNAPAGMPNVGIAPGSRLALSGKNLGPAEEVDFDGQAYTTELGGVSVQIQSGDVTTQALMHIATNHLVVVIVPSSTPVGDATVTVTYKGRTTAPYPIAIVPTSLGLRAKNTGGGYGPASAYNVPLGATSQIDLSVAQFPNTLYQSARPGQLMAVEATGLGAVTADETQSFLQVLDIPVDVQVGGKTATVMTVGRISSGEDILVFKLPDDVPVGCYVPVVGRAGGVTSNTVSISISAAGGSCSDVTGLSASDLDLAQKAGALKMGLVQLDRIEIDALGTDNEAGGTFARYDADSLQQAFAPAAANFGIRSSFATPPLGTCNVTPGSPTDPNHPLDFPGDRTPAQGLNVGAALNLSGPNGNAQLRGPSYYLNLADTGITPGEYGVDNGAGAQGFGAFKGTLTLPPMVTWTNKDTISAADRKQDLTVTWSGGAADKEYVLIAGVSTNQQATAGFACTEKVSAGKFTIPAWVLSSLPVSVASPNGPAGLLLVGTSPLTSAARFTAPGLDFAVFTYEQAVAAVVAYQ